MKKEQSDIEEAIARLNASDENFLQESVNAIDQAMRGLVVFRQHGSITLKQYWDNVKSFRASILSLPQENDLVQGLIDLYNHNCGKYLPITP